MEDIHIELILAIMEIIRMGIIQRIYMHGMNVEIKQKVIHFR